MPYTHPGPVCGAAKSLVLHFKSLDDLPMKIARRDGKRFIVKADDLLTAFLSLERDAIAPKGAKGYNPGFQQISWTTGDVGAHPSANSSTVICEKKHMTHLPARFTFMVLALV